MLNNFPQVWQERWQADGFDQATPIQEALWQPIQNGESLLGISPTGTGKTLAYLLPLLLKVRKGQGQQVLILAPNSELAGQIYEVTQAWAQDLGLKTQLFLSGSSQKRQMERLKKGPEVLIGTPGRVLELVKLKKIKLLSIDTIVLDEFDQLLSTSQLPFVERLLTYVPKTHTHIYMSATQGIPMDQLQEGTRLIALGQEEKSSHLQHFYMQVPQREKVATLRKLLAVDDFRALAFFNALSDVGNAEEKLQYHHLPAYSLASDINVQMRKQILDRFKDGSISLLLATDLVARGIDIQGLDCVIQVDLARDKDTYTHRAGRTGRMGRPGSVITFVSHPQELKQLKKYAKVSEIQLKNRELFLVEED
ncbi:DEAD/DEAH box helicase [Streptococcus sp. NLN76]|uniref:DEAD/DEAH box helicase n=1 Tax=Streptococcus sp. NLN76 TaxID=2822800 RepID=UPI0018AAF675|nr:DEAD/DEAH box helicase [Streptococcus sp. NLN76]MBF8970703.1 DEAD/DEAH box helicase [Streptococcus sp. NLN76]